MCPASEDQFVSRPPRSPTGCSIIATSSTVSVVHYVYQMSSLGYVALHRVTLTVYKRTMHASRRSFYAVKGRRRSLVWTRTTYLFPVLRGLVKTWVLHVWLSQASYLETTGMCMSVFFIKRWHTHGCARCISKGNRTTQMSAPWECVIMLIHTPVNHLLCKMRHVENGCFWKSMIYSFS